MKSSIGLPDKLAKQNEITRQKLTRELAKLENVQKSGLRMIETARHRFRSRHKNLEDSQQSSGSNAINVRMYETHNPGFCYHCTGAIKESGPPTKEKKTRKDSYEFVHSILFTNNEVDPEKILCLHVLTAHTTKWKNEDGFSVKPISSLLEKAREKHFSGAWNNVLPCYVVDTQHPMDNTLLENFKLHEDPRKLNLEDQAVRDFEQRYREYIQNNAEFGKALSAIAKQTRMAPCGLGKMPIISPHVYSLLGASHELRIKQALAESRGRRKFARSSVDLDILDEKSLSFNFEDEDDRSSRMTTNMSTKNWEMKSTRSPSKRSTIGSSLKHDRGITMLKSKHGITADHLAYKSDVIQKELITIKSSFRTFREAPSKTSSTKSPFRSMVEKPARETSSTTGFLTGTSSPGSAVKKYRKCIYLNSPIKCVELRDKACTSVPILVNYQVQALIQCVLEVLERVSPEKLRKIIEIANDPEKIRQMLTTAEMQNFIQFLMGQSLISSAESFVVSAATVTNEIDLRFERILEKEIIALTLEIPSLPCLEALIIEIRNNIFLDTRKKNGPINDAKGAFCTPERKKLKNENITENFFDARNNDDEKSRVTDMEKSMDEHCQNDKPSRTEIATEFKFNNRERQETKRDEKCEFLGQILDSKNCFKLNTVRFPIHASTVMKTKHDHIQEKKSDEEIKEQVRNTKMKRNTKRILTKESVLKKSTLHHEDFSEISFVKQTFTSKAWKPVQDPGYLDADRAILRKMTNNQRILVGKMCASLKTKRINNEGLINERMPLAAFIAPALSQESIRALTRGTTYSKTVSIVENHEDVEDGITVPDKLSGPMLAKIRQDVAESETKKRLKCFLENITE